MMALTFLKTIRLNKLLPGVLLLGLLFLYDIFWVFYSTKLSYNTVQTGIIPTLECFTHKRTKFLPHNTK